jgi:hypothetical protein
MAVTRLSDVITPEVYPLMDKQTTIRTTRKAAVYQSGLVVSDNYLSKKLAGGGETFNVPFYNDLSRTESNIASDDPSSEATPEKITTGKDIARRQYRTQGWSSARLTAALSGDDPMRAIKELTSQYWADDLDLTAIKTLDGVIADNVANDSGDMVHDIATDDAGAATDAELISAEAILDARQTMGDASDIGCVMIMHSVCFTKLKKLNLIDYIPDSEGRIKFQTYLGDKIWISDEVTKVTGSNRITYNTYIAKPGLLKHGTSPAEMPVEVDSLPRQADGAGVEEIWMRKQNALHIPGIKWTEASVASDFPTNAELAAAANWDRVYAERKQIPLICLKTNG